MRRLFSFLTICLSFLFLFVPVARAEDKSFNIDLNATYSVRTDGTTTVAQQFTLTNTTPTIYAKQYALEFGSTKLKNVRVSDSNGKIPANITSTNNKTSVGITFNDMVVGEGKQRKFTIEFDSDDIALISGNVLEVYIPQFSDYASYNSYTVAIRTPSQFGRPARVHPAPQSTALEGNQVVMQFSQPKNLSIAALFGQQQVFQYNLRYHLSNPTGNVGIAQVAFPPDTARQKVQFFTLDPKPRQIETDADGNWIATYEVAAEKDLEVLLTGQAALYLTNQNTVPAPAPSDTYLQTQKYWPTQDPKIQELAKKYSTPREIYDYVVKTLSYNYDALDSGSTRLGAVQVLSNPTAAACQEFTDLFIAMARAAGIPARRMTGFAYTQNSRLRPLSLIEDILHAWPEYYDAERKQWIPIDPTWGNTTGGYNYFDEFDFNHLTLAINGVNDTQPYPAGSYKKETEKTKDVEVSFGKAFALPNLTISANASMKPFWYAMMGAPYDLQITNETGVAWYNLPLRAQLESGQGQVEGLPETIPTLLPYQTISYPFHIKGVNWWQPQAVRLTLTVDQLSSTHVLQTGFQIKKLGQTIKDTLQTLQFDRTQLGVGLVIVAFLTGGLLVSGRSRHRPVRRQGKKS